jgi:hypothetical protein
VTLLVAVLLAARGAGAEEPRPGGAVVENRLAKERSPYLRQHRTNPVDWWPWGPEALAKAAREGKPIFLSVGYAACHWCHVMEHESFEDAATAKLLNDVFVCVKVDREERPDLDRVYMSAVQLLTGRGGWPMTVLLTPDGRPFYGGTYFPREQLQELVRRVREAWVVRREALDQQASAIAERLRELADGPSLPPVAGGDAEIVARLGTALAEAFDPVHGGFGTRPKFPPHSELLLLLERGAEPAGDDALGMARATLEAMDEGGIHDQVGGGFHRYSTDEVWLVPHFEKMLYDNALLARAYAAGFARTGAERFARAARRTLAWVVRELARPGGGYASSLDADTQGHEGVTYTWTPDEVLALLGAADGAFVASALGMKPEGNYAEEATGEPTRRNIPHLPRPLDEVARAHGLAGPAFHARLDPLLERLRVARDERPQPGLDDKVIAGWNGLLLSAFAAAGRDLKDASWLAKGRELAAFLLEQHRRAEGTLLRFPRGSGPEIPGFAEDLVHVAEGLLDLAEATGEARWADAARATADDLLQRFEDREGGGIWASSEGAHEALIARAKEVWDSPIPSDNGTAARLLLRLSARTGDPRYRAAADRILAAYRPLLGHAQTARGVVALCRALALRVALGEKAGAAEPLAPGDAHVAQGVAEVDAWLERAEAAPGARVRFAVRVVLADGWHVNASDAPADRTATALRLAEKSPVRLASIAWPAPEPTAPGAPDGYAGAFWVRGELELPAGAPLGPRRASLVLTLQPCDATSCREPEDVRLDLPLRFAAEDGPARHAGVFAR